MSAITYPDPTLNSENTSHTTIPVTPVATYILIIINIAVFVLTMNQNIWSIGGTNRIFVWECGEFYRLVSAMFLHIDVTHVIANMVVLYNVGRILEGYFGHLYFLLIYLLSGLCGSVTSLQLNSPEISSVGASGAVLACFGAEIFLVRRYKNLLDVNLGWSYRFVALSILYGYQRMPRGTTAETDFLVDYWAHIGGLVGGIIVAWLISFSFTVRWDLEVSKLILVVNNVKLVKRALVGVVFIVVALSLTGISLFSSREIVVDNITLKFPGGWHIITDIEDKNVFKEQCADVTITCLLYAEKGGVEFKIIRFGGAETLFMSLDDVADLLNSEVQSQGQDLFSREKRQMDGVNTVVLTYRDDSITHKRILLKDRGVFVQFIISGVQDDYSRMFSEINRLYTSIQLDIPASQVVAASTQTPTLTPKLPTLTPSPTELPGTVVNFNIENSTLHVRLPSDWLWTTNSSTHAIILGNSQQALRVSDITELNEGEFYGMIDFMTHDNSQLEALGVQAHSRPQDIIQPWIDTLADQFDYHLIEHPVRFMAANGSMAAIAKGTVSIDREILDIALLTISMSEGVGYLMIYAPQNELQLYIDDLRYTISTFEFTPS